MRRVLRYICATIIIVPILWVCFGLLHMIVIYPIAHSRGWIVPGAASKTNKAIQEGNGKEAIYWAEKTYAMVIKAKPNLQGSPEWIIPIALAYDLDGKKEKALCFFELAYRYGDPNMLAKIVYKQGDRQKAFELYCEFVDAKDGNVQKVLASTLDEPGSLYISPLILSPFPLYSDFVTFMEEEHEKLGKPEKYREAMEKIREVQRGEQRPVPN